MEPRRFRWLADAFLRIPFDEWSRVAASTGVTLRREHEHHGHDPR